MKTRWLWAALTCTLAIGCASAEEDAASGDSAIAMGASFLSPLEAGWYGTDDGRFTLHVKNEAPTQWVSLTGPILLDASFVGFADVDVLEKVVRVEATFSAHCIDVELRSTGADVSLSGRCGRGTEATVFSSTIFRPLAPATLEGRFVGANARGQGISIDVSNVEPERARIRVTIGDSTTSYGGDPTGLAFGISDRCGKLHLSTGWDLAGFSITEDYNAADCPVFEWLRQTPKGFVGLTKTDNAARE